MYNNRSHGDWQINLIELLQTSHGELGIYVGQVYNWRTQFNKLSKKRIKGAGEK